MSSWLLSSTEPYILKGSIFPEKQPHLLDDSPSLGQSLPMSPETLPICSLPPLCTSLQTKLTLPKVKIIISIHCLKLGIPSHQLQRRSKSLTRPLKSRVCSSYKLLTKPSSSLTHRACTHAACPVKPLPTSPQVACCPMFTFLSHLLCYYETPDVKIHLL